MTNLKQSMTEEEWDAYVAEIDSSLGEKTIYGSENIALLTDEFKKCKDRISELELNHQINRNVPICYLEPIYNEDQKSYGYVIWVNHNGRKLKTEVHQDINDACVLMAKYYGRLLNRVNKSIPPLDDKNLAISSLLKSI